MSGDGGQSDPNIPVVFLFSADAQPLISALIKKPDLVVRLVVVYASAPVEGRGGLSVGIGVVAMSRIQHDVSNSLGTFISHSF